MSYSYSPKEHIPQDESWKYPFEFERNTACILMRTQYKLKLLFLKVTMSMTELW